MLANSKHHQLLKIWNTMEKGRFWEMQRPALKMMIQIDFQQLESHNGGDTLESGDSLTQTIHVWYICLQLVEFYGKCW